MEFLTRDQYLWMRQQWKTEYMELAQRIRALKIATRLASKAGYSAQARVNEEKQAVSSVLQSLRAKDSNFAHYMMNNLEELKANARVSVAFMKFLESTKNAKV